MKQLGRALALAAGISIGLGAALVVAPEHAGLIGHVWLVGMLALALGFAVRRLLHAVPRQPSAFDAAFAPVAATRARPASLARIEREVTLAAGTAFDVHFRLRPVIRELAAGFLLRRGIDLEWSPDRARAVLGPDTWELARPDRGVPDDRTAPGLPIATVSLVVDDLERLACN